MQVPVPVLKLPELPLFEEFLNYLDAERNFSPHTINAYSSDLAQFCQFLCPPPPQPGDAGQAAQPNTPPAKLTSAILAVTPMDVRSFLSMMRASDYCKATTARKLATLRSFYKFLVRAGHLETSPVTVIRTPRQDKHLPKFLDLLTVSSFACEILGARDRAIMETVYSSGLRISELVGLNIEDLDEFSEALRIRGKGKKERLVPLGSKAIEANQHYLDMRGQGLRGGALRHGPLYVNKQCRRLNERSIRRKLDTLAGLEQKISDAEVLIDLGETEQGIASELSDAEQKFCEFRLPGPGGS